MLHSHKVNINAHEEFQCNMTWLSMYRFKHSKEKWMTNVGFFCGGGNWGGHRQRKKSWEGFCKVKSGLPGGQDWWSHSKQKELACVKAPKTKTMWLGLLISLYTVFSNSPNLCQITHLSRIEFWPSPEK